MKFCQAQNSRWGKVHFSSQTCTAMWAVTPICPNSSFAVWASLSQGRTAIGTSDEIWLDGATAFWAESSKRNSHHFAQLFPKLLKRRDVKTETEPSTACPNPFSAIATQNLTLLHHLTILTNTSPATLTNSNGFKFSVFVATHGLSPTRFLRCSTEIFASPLSSRKPKRGTNLRLRL